MFIKKKAARKGREGKTDQNLRGTMERKKRFLYFLCKIVEKKENKRDREIHRKNILTQEEPC